MWFIGVEVEQETSAPPPKKNPGSAPAAGFATCLVRYVPVRYMFAADIQCRDEVSGRDVLVHVPVLTSPNTSSLCIKVWQK